MWSRTAPMSLRRRSTQILRSGSIPMLPRYVAAHDRPEKSSDRAISSGDARYRRFSIDPRTKSGHLDEIHNARSTWDHEIDSKNILSLTAGFDRLHSLLTPEPNAVRPQVT